MIDRLVAWYATRSARFWWVAFVLWAALIFVLSAQPNLTIVPDALLDFVLRKIAHFTFFGLLAVFAWSALRTQGVDRPWLLAIGIAAAYAVSDELHQSFVNGRHAAPMDVLIDTCGAIVAIWLAERLTRRMQLGRS